MKVFQLRCSQTHDFEGWFASSEEFDSQIDRGLVRCPHCDSAEILRIPAAAHLNLALRPPAALATGKQAWLRELRELVAATEDVGERFAEEARRIHYGEVEERAIRGTSSPTERADLIEEGIEVFTLPALLARKEPLQ
jgi:hypothetical protein